MKPIITEILYKELGKNVLSISEILNFGSVNNVFDVTCQDDNYIVRFNKSKDKRLEFLKEEWCINAARELGVLTPKVLANGLYDGYPYMIQEKIEGKNGSSCSDAEKVNIWKSLGENVVKYNPIEAIEIPALQAAEFHDNWQSKLEYNINQLNSEDTLLSDNIFSLTEHDEIKMALISMKSKGYKIGLIHGDLSPRNVIVNESIVHLIDWGTAEIGVVPYSEIGIILIAEEANEEEFYSFLDGMGITKKEYHNIEIDIRKLNLLHLLDKYRWATSYDSENLTDYTEKIRLAYKKWSCLK